MDEWMYGCMDGWMNESMLNDEYEDCSFVQNATTYENNITTIRVLQQ